MTDMAPKPGYSWLAVDRWLAVGGPLWLPVVDRWTRVNPYHSVLNRSATVGQTGL